MIGIDRGAPPPALDPSSAGDDYSKKDVVLALWDMQHGKCCYCELRIPQKGLGKHVEHHRPKATYTDLRNSWQNLLLACPQCNGKKADRYPMMVDTVRSRRKLSPLLLDPSLPADEPAQHLCFCVDDSDAIEGMVLARDGSERGRVTVDVLGLARSYYVEQRRDHLEKLRTAHLLFLRQLGVAERRLDIEAARTSYEHLVGYSESAEPLSALTREFRAHKRIDYVYETVVSRIEART